MADAFQSFLRNKPTDDEVYLSLFLDEHTVAASFWRQGAGEGVARIAASHKTVESGEWKDRIIAVDALLGQLEEKAKLQNVTATILGLSNGFLTSSGEIRKDVRAEIKRLASELDLTIAGFVPLTQAVIYKLKTDEGVPPSVILLGINMTTIAVSLYKIGALVGVRDIEKHDDVASELELALKSFTEMEVLPARIFLYGSDPKQLEEVKTKLLHHPWTTKANFLHFPKIEIVSGDLIIDAISLAGASEMKHEPPQHEESDTDVSAEAAVPAASLPTEKEDTEEKNVETIEAEADAAPQEAEVGETTREVAEAGEILREDFTVDQETVEDANVVMVDAESLGFKKDTDVLEQEEQVAEAAQTHPHAAASAAPPVARARHMAQTAMHAVSGVLSKIKVPAKKFPIGVGALIIAGVLVAGLGFWSLPKAAVTVLTIPQAVSASETVVFDPEATAVDSASDTIPARTREQSVGGEKTVPVAGKKSVGDPALGTITIYNKSLSIRTFNKGAILVSGSLKFTLDSEVRVASASESVGSITFGKQAAAVTASAIGAQSNLPAGSEFTFTDISSGVATARNETAFTGGTSREVTVVTRADNDALVKDVSEELTVKAQEQLATAVAGGEQMIEETIKTTVTEKVFDQEIDQEANQLHGKITVTVSGVTYSQNDIHAFLVSKGALSVPDGYTLKEVGSTVTLTKVKVNKDGTISARANLEATALPKIDTASLPAALAGKSIKDAEMYLRGIPGVGGVQVVFRFSPGKSRIPFNRKNISISMSVVQ